MCECVYAAVYVYVHTCAPVWAGEHVHVWNIHLEAYADVWGSSCSSSTLFTGRGLSFHPQLAVSTILDGYLLLESPGSAF